MSDTAYKVSLAQELPNVGPKNTHIDTPTHIQSIQSDGIITLKLSPVQSLMNTEVEGISFKPKEQAHEDKATKSKLQGLIDTLAKILR